MSKSEVKSWGHRILQEYDEFSCRMERKTAGQEGLASAWDPHALWAHASTWSGPDRECIMLKLNDLEVIRGWPPKEIWAEKDNRAT